MGLYCAAKTTFVHYNRNYRQLLSRKRKKFFPGIKWLNISWMIILKDQFDKDGIYIFAILFHSHHGNIWFNYFDEMLIILNYLSHKVKFYEIRHYKNDKINKTFRYNNYDYGYQPYRHLKEYIHFLRGDKIVNICGHNSMNETKSFTVINLLFIQLTRLFSKNKNSWIMILMKNSRFFVNKTFIISVKSWFFKEIGLVLLFCQFL